MRRMLVLALAAAAAAHAGAATHRSGWTVAPLAGDRGDQRAEAAIDGDPRTAWRSPVGCPHGLSIDIGRPATLAGVTIVWGNDETLEYRVSASADGRAWTVLYHTRAGDGRKDELVLRPTRARHLKVECLNWSDSGHSIRELACHQASDAVRVEEVPAGRPDALFDLFDGSLDRTWTRSAAEPRTIRWDFGRPVPLSGLHIEWGESHARDFDVSTSVDGIVWERAHRVRDAIGIADVLPLRAGNARGLRLDLLCPRPGRRSFAIRELTLKGKDDLSGWLRLLVAARKRRAGLYPESLHGRQVYWTVVGVPGDAEESLLDEHGSLEAAQGSCTLSPFMFIEGRLHSFADARRIETWLDGGWRPAPAVRWDLGSLELTIQAVGGGPPGRAQTHVRYSVRNAGSTRRAASLVLASRPVSINPPWQHGGLSPIRTIACRGSTIEVDDRLRFDLSPPPSAAGARAFESGDVVEDLAAGRVPPAGRATDDAGLASAAARFDMELAPGETRHVHVSVPLHPTVAARNDPARTFDERLHAARLEWSRAAERVTFELPDRRVMDVLRSQLAYILINQDGPSLQPGSRKYGRAWMRDGASIAQALLRFGLDGPVREFLTWYSARIIDSGLVPPMLNADGTVFTGHGSNLEWDSQGEYVHTLMEYFRLTGDRSLISTNIERIRRALAFLVRLRARTLDPGYRRGETARERFRGILPPSISHEGYYPPMHSYWDVFWSLRGWRDGAEAARLAQRPDLGTWATDEYRKLLASARATIRATRSHARIAHVPGCADTGDLDASATAILWSPLELADALPRAWLQATFDAYQRGVSARLEGRSNPRYTPYELRNVTALVRLGQVERAHVLLASLMTGIRPSGWNHWAEVVTPDVRRGEYIGDMPHSWIGAEFVNVVRQMVANEVDGELELLRGARASWLTTGDGIRVARLPTHFGRLGMTARMAGSKLVVQLQDCPAAPRGIRVFWPLTRAPRHLDVDGCSVSLDGGPSVLVPGRPRRLIATW